MAKISLSVDVTWPDGKTKVFTSGEQERGIAWLPDTVKDWYVYAEGYKEAAEAVFSAWESSTVHRDELVFPLVFLWRQHLELRLKELLQASHRLLELPQDWKCDHRIDKLWSTLRPLLERIWPHTPKPDFDHVEAMIREFAERDPISMEFRYPKSREGQAHLRELEHLDVMNFRLAMQQLSAFLSGANEGIAEFQKIQNSL